MDSDFVENNNAPENKKPDSSFSSPDAQTENFSAEKIQSPDILSEEIPDEILSKKSISEEKTIENVSIADISTDDVLTDDVLTEKVGVQDLLTQESPDLGDYTAPLPTSKKPKTQNDICQEAHISIPAFSEFADSGFSSIHPRLNVQIRWMTNADLPSVLAIETSCFKFAWTMDDFIMQRRQRNCIGWVAVYNRQIIGFLMCHEEKNHQEILNMAVDAKFRRRTVGTQLIRRMIDKLSRQKKSYSSLILWERSVKAQIFFRKMGFVAKKVLKNFYQSLHEDAYQMFYDIKKKTNEPSEVVNNPTSRP